MFVFRSIFETTILASFPPNSLNYTAINLFLQKFSTLTIAKFATSTRTDVRWQASEKELRAVTMRVHSHLILGMITALLNLLRTSNVRIQCVRKHFACRKRHYNTLQSAEPNINGLNASPCVRCSIFLLRNEFVFLEVWPRDVGF